ncbi:transposase [Candidatus Enterovibrio escicola]|uniref:Transposase DDE domain-containing protein n=1 Tax=Candidatus Enterovibrio escicola TaxID=1927127 RepID=A0A2A5T2L3_9GAMM|nr:transposase [Candidatus Enterovibrio escacola]PCS22370.1 hypothetical protein BTN49_2099 [Candidatus Enterovibrio escacola]
MSKASRTSWPFVYILDTQIETALMMKGIFKLPLRALEGFFSSVFTVINIPLKSFTYTCMNQW